MFATLSTSHCFEITLFVGLVICHWLLKDWAFSTVTSPVLGLWVFLVDTSVIISGGHIIMCLFLDNPLWLVLGTPLILSEQDILIVETTAAACRSLCILSQSDAQCCVRVLFCSCLSFASVFFSFSVFFSSVFFPLALCFKPVIVITSLSNQRWAWQCR